MDAYDHARFSAKRYGGVPEDYVKVHLFLDSSKSTFCNFRHRAILHNSFGIELALQVFGPVVDNSAGRKVSVRLICENHITEDVGFVPSVQDWCENIRPRKWMMRDLDARQAVVTNNRLAKENLNGADSCVASAPNGD